MNEIMTKLWSVVVEIGNKVEEDQRYMPVFRKLEEALNEAEAVGLITYEENEEEEV